MINVFIDISIFVAEGYVKGKSIATLFEAAQEEKIHILMPDITEYEIRRHLHKNVAEVYTNAKFSHLGCLCYKPETLK